MKRYPFAAAAAGLLILFVTSGAATTPTATTPAPTAPIATVPAPTVPAPTVPAPPVPAPTVPAPTVSAPTAPVPTAPVPTAPASIVISGFDYHGDLTVKSGQEVIVTNMDPVPILHTLTDKQTGLFNTGPIAPGGGTASFTAPAQPGSYPFGCLFHLTMAGILVVQG